MFSVYLVDDEAKYISSFAARKEFINHDFRVIGTASTATQALEQILSLRPDVVFTDMCMPGMTGLELMSAVRAVRPEMIFVIASAYSDFDYLRQALRQEAFDYLIKPITLETLSECLLSLHARLRDGSAQYDIPPQANETFINILRYLRNNLNEQHSMQQLADRFCVSISTLGGYFNKFLNTSFIAWLTDCRMQQAVMLLTDTACPLKEIAKRCGYTDYFYFCRVFQKTYKKTPSEVRVEGRQHENKP